jgi:hypothetical protein
MVTVALVLVATSNHTDAGGSRLVTTDEKVLDNRIA